MSDDDDTGGGKKHKTLQQVEAAGEKPVTLKLWVVTAIAVAAFLLGVWLG